MKTQEVPSLRPFSDGGAEPDCVHWPAGLDLEPETCFCLIHGDELPCGICSAASTKTQKES